MKSFILSAIIIGFLLPLNSSAAKKLKLADSVALNAAAPDFRLKDISGKEVTLSSLKGKVVVLDFWATWCVPCHENFPAVQKVVDHYKNDPNVVFLFIDTREKSADYVQLAKADMEKNHYDFHVLFDEQGPDGKQNKYYSTLGMAGIPTRFIIDANGIIRDKSVGYDDRYTDAQKVAAAIKVINDIKASAAK
jgi:cytochrome c biogenesis protein CcmG/thiol:disulfide interchange protein DsbE